MLNQHIGKKAGSGVTKGKKHKGNIRLTHQSVVQGKKPMIIHISNKEDRSSSTLFSVENSSLVMVHNKQLNALHQHSSCKYRLGN